MKNTCLGLVLAASSLPLAAQDRIHLVSGAVIENARVQSFDINQLRYAAKGATETMSSDKVARLEMEKFADVYKRGISSNDPGQFVVVAKDKDRVKDATLAQLGLVKAANLFMDQGQEAQAFAVLDELQKEYPTGGLVPEVFRLKMEYYLSKGPDGARNANIVATKYVTEATTGAWPQGFLYEGEFFKILADGAGGAIDPQTFQARLRDQLPKVQGTYPVLASRISVQMAHSMREHGNPDGARKIYEEILTKDAVDANSRAGAYLGLGQLRMTSADASNKDAYKEALLLFLRVRLETKECWPSLQAEALYNSILAAEKWQGEDWRYVKGKCLFLLANEYPNTEWAARAKAK